MSALEPLAVSVASPLEPLAVSLRGGQFVLSFLHCLSYDGHWHGIAVIIFRTMCGKIEENGVAVFAGGCCRPYGSDRKITAENGSFLRVKTYIACLLTGKLQYRNKSVNNQIF